MARRQTARPLPAWVGDLPVFERTLANGFKALVLPRSHAPLVVCDLYYPVGSVDEPAGKTGLAHFVEHMLFKGTERLPKGQIDRLAFVAAGQSNAETGEDCTHYWFAFPSDRWELALTVEADRMRGASFDPREVEAERHVIAEERARDLDSPLGRLDQTHMAVAYLRHPYRNPILGWPDDLARIGVDDLRGFYRAHYRPDGAVLVVVGDVDPEAALDRVAAHFEPLAPGDSPRVEPTSDEPRQTGRRDFSLVESEAVARGMLGWHTVPQGHPDGPALDVASDLLTCGRRSRLWDDLVERGRVATWVETAQEGRVAAGQFLVQVEAAPGVETARVEAGDRRDPRPAGRRGAVGRGAGAVEAPARGRLALGAGRPGGPGLRARPRRALGRLARLAGRAPRGPGRRGRRRPPRRLDLPDRLEPDRRLVAAPPGRAVTVLLPTETIPPPAPSRRAAGASSTRSRWPCRTASRGWPTSARIARPCPTACGSSPSAGRGPGSWRWSCSSTPACSARPSRAWPT